MSATEQNVPGSPNVPAASRQPSGCTPSCLPSRATNICAFWAPNPGSSATRWRSSAPLAASPHTRLASPPYRATISWLRAWTRAAIDLGYRCSAGRSVNTAASASGS